jgi:hypothetical protein
MVGNFTRAFSLLTRAAAARFHCRRLISPPPWLDLTAAP